MFNESFVLIIGSEGGWWWGLGRFWGHWRYWLRPSHWRPLLSAMWRRLLCQKALDATLEGSIPSYLTFCYWQNQFIVCFLGKNTRCLLNICYNDLFRRLVYSRNWLNLEILCVNVLYSKIKTIEWIKSSIIRIELDGPHRVLLPIDTNKSILWQQYIHKSFREQVKYNLRK